MPRHFCGWEDSEMKTDKVWTGSKLLLFILHTTFIVLNAVLTFATVLGYSSDFMPHIGEVPGKPGQFMIAGFTGYGMPKILLSSKALAKMVRDGASFEQTGLPRIFKTTKERNESESSPLEESLKSLWTETPKL